MTDKDLNKFNKMGVKTKILKFNYFPNKKLQRCKRILDARYNRRKLNAK